MTDERRFVVNCFIHFVVDCVFIDLFVVVVVVVVVDVVLVVVVVGVVVVVLGVVVEVICDVVNSVCVSGVDAFGAVVSVGMSVVLDVVCVVEKVFGNVNNVVEGDSIFDVVVVGTSVEVDCGIGENVSKATNCCCVVVPSVAVVGVTFVELVVGFVIVVWSGILDEVEEGTIDVVGFTSCVVLISPVVVATVVESAELSKDKAGFVVVV